MRVLLVTTWDRACGIAEHSAYLKEAVEAADPSITVLPHCQQTPTLLHPDLTDVPDYNVLHLNYHAALHSQWTPDWIRRWRTRAPVVVTYHDTGVPNTEQCRGVVEAADVTIVHEPAEDLPAERIRYWRMGVPSWQPPAQFGRRSVEDEPVNDLCFKQWSGQPVLGTVGFPLPWKNYERLCEVTHEAGWGLLLIAPAATAAQMAAWHARQPALSVWVGEVGALVSRRMVVSLLAACDATAFCYTCANAGQSAAILQGIAARKPVFAFHTCRQFRTLFDLGGIAWGQHFDGGTVGADRSLATWLRSVPIQRVDPGIVALAEQESWVRLGAKYAALYRSLR